MNVSEVNPNNLPVKPAYGAVCSVDPLYCDNQKAHECFNPDSCERAWVSERNYNFRKGSKVNLLAAKEVV